MRRLNYIAITITASLMASGAQAIDADIGASLRMGLTYDETSESGEIFMRNFGSRLTFATKAPLKNDNELEIYTELGINPDSNTRGESGIDRTRQLWVGLNSELGTLRAGTQYAAFYDMVSSHTDIAWWGSCWTQLECSVETQVLKFSGTSDKYSYAFSASLPDDSDGDLLNNLEFGVNYSKEDYTLGLGGAINSVEGTNESGTTLGVMGKGTVGPIDVAVTYQDFDGNAASALGGGHNLTISGQMDNFYVVVNNGDTNGNTQGYSTLGYTHTINENTLMYFEYQNIGVENGSSDTIGRAVLKHDIK